MSLSLVISAALGLFAGLQGTADASIGIVPKSFHAEALNRDGSPDLEAGSHPYAYKVSFELAHDASGSAEGSARDVVVELPPGFAGNPLSLPRCPREDVEAELATCSGDTQIGRFEVISRDPEQSFAPAGAVYNLEPSPGSIASFGFSAAGFNAIQNVSLIDDNGIQRVLVTTNNLPVAHIVFASLTVWGEPQDPSHDSERQCYDRVTEEFITGCASSLPRRPFVSLPGSCGSPLVTLMKADFVEEPGNFFPEETESRDLEGKPAGLYGCELLEFKPTVAVQTERSGASEPTGLRVGIHLPQAEPPGGLVEGQVRDAVVTLPPGVAINPAAAGGLTACSEAQIEIHQDTPPSCPASSQIGTVEVHTPVLDHPLPGRVYLAEQGKNPFGSVVAIYLVVDDPLTGAIVKLAGHVEADPATGQLKTTFTDLPQLPFEDVTVNLNGGQRAPLMTPSTCGRESATALFTPWTGGPDVAGGNALEVTSGPGGGACAHTPSEEPHHPAFEAGAAVPLAGSYSPFVLKLSREDGSQILSSLSVTMPPGLTGKLAGITRCSDAQIAAAQAEGRTGKQEKESPSCPASSQIGTVTSALGAGSDPFYIGAPVYLAGPYKGAPFSLAIIVPAIAGPYDLGTVVVRTALFVNPETAQVTAVSDPFPTILDVKSPSGETDGLPTDIRAVTVTLDRPEFILNPTSCAPMSIVGTATSTLGVSAPLSARFQVGGCAALSFAPKFSATTSAHTSKLNGASLEVKVTQQPGEANIHTTTLQLPKILPSRAETLQEACTEQQFASNPAGCPPVSNIGTATAITPVLGVPLTGPAYLVSHGGAAFPDVVFILQGEGVTVDVVAHTDIKNGITYSHLESVPDAPVRSFDAVFPSGRHSIFGAIGNLCAKPLHIVVKAGGQNGRASESSPAITVTGCPHPSVKVKAKGTRHGVLLKLRSSQPGQVAITGKGLRSMHGSVGTAWRTFSIPFAHSAARRGSVLSLKVHLQAVGGASTAVVRVRSH